MVHACAFFNNKGGVGKTTNVANLGHALSSHGSTVVVDLDPQCNLTQYFLSDEQWETIFQDQAEMSDSTIWKFVKPLSQAKTIDSTDPDNIVVYESDRFGFDLVLGHPFVSRLEDGLAEQWANFRQGKIGGIETTFWCHQLIEVLAESQPGLEYVVFDLGPSLGPLNRSVLLACDSFVAPVSPDLFSLYSFDNLTAWFRTLNRMLGNTVNMLEDEPEIHENRSRWWYPRYQQGLSIDFLGYISQEYVTRSTKGERRRTKAYARFLESIPEKAESLDRELSETEKVKRFGSYEIGVMPHMFSMVALAHDVHSPIADLKASDGLNGAQFRQRDRYVEDMEHICAQWVSRMRDTGLEDSSE